MNTPSTSTAPVTETSAAPGDAPGDGADDFDARLHALKADDGTASESAPETTASVPPAPASEAVSDAAAARRARLAELSQKMRRQVDSRPAQPSEDYASKYEAAQRRLQELEASQAKYVDPTKLDEAGFFQLASSLNISPQKLGEFLRTATLNPEVVAAQAAQKALDPRIAAAEERAAKAEQMVQEFLAQQQAAQQEAQASQVMHQFVSSITPDESPHAATFIRAFGQGEFLKVAESAANGLPAGAGRQALLDTIEENLSMLVNAFAPPSAPKQPTTPFVPAAAKATTVSNAHAQTRASVVEDDDFASLPFDERVARLKDAV